MKFKYLLFLSLFTQAIFGMENEIKLKFDSQQKIGIPPLKYLSLRPIARLYSEAEENKPQFLEKFPQDLHPYIQGHLGQYEKSIFTDAFTEATPTCITISKCGKYVAIGSKKNNNDHVIHDSKIKILDLLNPTSVSELKLGHDANSIKFSPSNNYLAATSTKKTRIWDWKKEKLVFKVSDWWDQPKNLIFNDCETYISRHRINVIKFWNLKNNITPFDLNKSNHVRSIDIASHDKQLACLYVDSVVDVWDFNTNPPTVLNSFKLQESLLLKPIVHGSIIFSPCNKYLVIGYENRVYFFNLLENQVKNIYIPHGSEITSIVFSPCGKYLYTASTDTKIKVWNVENKNLIKHVITLDDHTESVNQIDISGCGRYLASCSDDNTVIIYDLWKIVP